MGFLVGNTVELIYVCIGHVGCFCLDIHGFVGVLFLDSGGGVVRLIRRCFGGLVFSLSGLVVI